MGCTDSKDKDPYQLVLNKHGIEQVRQLIVSYTKAQFIETSKSQILNVLQQKINQLKMGLMNEVESVKNEIDKKFQKSLQRIQQSDPSAIPKAEKFFKSRIDELMGYKDAIKRVSEYKQQCKISFQREQDQTMNYLKNFFKEFQEEQRQNIPELQKYESLDEDEQQKFLKTAKQKNKTSVQKGLNEIQKVIEDKCNFQNFEPKFRSIISKEKLHDLVKFAQKSFMSSQQKIKGSSDCRTC